MMATRLKALGPHYAGASPPPTPIAAASARALELVLDDPQLRERLRCNTAALKTGLRERGFSVDDTPVPIVALELGDAANMQQVHQALVDQGIMIAYFPRYAGLGPEGALRIAVFATHSDAMIEQLLDALASAA